MKKLLNHTKNGFEADRLRRSLKNLIVGQNEAIEEIVSSYQLHQSGMTSPERPISNLLFLGPTGSGKTRIVEATAQCLIGSLRAIIKIDCAEFQHSHEIAKLIGSPPGYLGHRETHPMLSQEVLNHHHTNTCEISFVLFDEIEKASDALWNLLLGILDKATLTLGDNRRVDFSRTMIFMTSNLGASEMGSILSPQMGFNPVALAPGHSASLDGKLNTKISRVGVGAARRKFTPEFINRLDNIVVFHPLGEAELRQVLEIELRVVHQRIFAGGRGIFPFTLSNLAKDLLLREGTDPRYGARQLKRAIEQLIVKPLSNIISTGQVDMGDEVYIDVINSKMAFYKKEKRRKATA